MSIDSKELKKFLEVFAPAVAALPAVINAAEQEEELTRNVVILEDRMQKVLADEKYQLNLFAESVASAKAELQDLGQQRLKLTQEVKTAKKEALINIAAAKTQADEAILSHQARMKEVASQLSSVEGDLVRRLAEAEAVMAKQRAEHLTAIAELVSKKEDAEKALEGLRSRLG